MFYIHMIAMLSFSAKAWRLKAFQSCCLLYCIPFPGMILGLWAAACEGTGLGKFGKPPGGVGRWGNCSWLGPDPGTPDPSVTSNWGCLTTCWGGEPVSKVIREKSRGGRFLWNKN